jgi:hypothetical protein
MLKNIFRAFGFLGLQPAHGGACFARVVYS